MHLLVQFDAYSYPDLNMGAGGNGLAKQQCQSTACLPYAKKTLQKLALAVQACI